mmetsp:Transcript_12377/g.34316  ORF Transcript_12377/g.34316 Transcript_12377/m.34316 type:complete len:640 (-) Transcript_12377:160-2079(-)
MPNVRPSSRKRPGIGGRAVRNVVDVGMEFQDAHIAPFVPYGRGDLLHDAVSKPNPESSRGVDGEKTTVTKTSPDSVLLANDLWVHEQLSAREQLDLATKTPMRENADDNQVDVCRTASKDDPIDKAAESQPESGTTQTRQQSSSWKVAPRRRRKSSVKSSVTKTLDYKHVSETLPGKDTMQSEAVETAPCSESTTQYKRELDKIQKEHLAAQEAWAEKELRLQKEIDQLRSKDNEILTLLKGLVTSSPSIAKDAPTRNNNQDKEDITWWIERIAERTKNSERKIADLTEQVESQSKANNQLKCSHQRSLEHSRELENKLERETENYEQLQRTHQSALCECQELERKVKDLDVDCNFLQTLVGTRQQRAEGSETEIDRLNKEKANLQMILGVSHEETRAAKQALRLSRLRRDQSEFDSDQTESESDSDSESAGLLQLPSSNSQKRTRTGTMLEASGSKPKRVKTPTTSVRSTGSRTNSLSKVAAASSRAQSTSWRNRRSDLEIYTATNEDGSCGASSLESSSTAPSQRKPRPSSTIIQRSRGTALPPSRSKPSPNSSWSSMRASRQSATAAPDFHLTRCIGRKATLNFLPSTRKRITQEITQEVANKNVSRTSKISQKRFSSGASSLSQTSESSASRSDI